MYIILRINFCIVLFQYFWNSHSEIIKRTHWTSLQPLSNTVKMKSVITNSPDNCALGLICGVLEGLAFDAGSWTWFLQIAQVSINMNVNLKNKFIKNIYPKPIKPQHSIFLSQIYVSRLYLPSRIIIKIIQIFKKKI